MRAARRALVAILVGGILTGQSVAFSQEPEPDADAEVGETEAVEPVEQSPEVTAPTVPEVTPVTAFPPGLPEPPPVVAVEAPSQPERFTAAVGDDYETTVLSDDPLGYWRLNETSGSVAHDSAGSIDGAYVGTLTKGQAGIGGSNAVAFNGSTGHVFLTDGWNTDGQFLATPEFTIEAWIKTNSSTGFDRILRWRWCGWGLSLRNGDAEGDLHTGTSCPSSYTNTALEGPDINDGNWHHLVLAFDGDAARLYVDARLRDWAALPGTSNVYYACKETAPTAPGCLNWDPYGDGGGVGIAQEGDDDVYFFQGTIDEVAVYDHALSRAAVRDHFRTAEATTGYAIGSSETLGSADETHEAGDPVNPATGNFTDEWADFGAQPGTYPMPWARTYNSIDVSASVLGTGWTTPAETSATATGPGDVDVRAPSGRHLIFNRTGTSAWERPDGFDGDLVELSSPTRYAIEFPDGGSWEFDVNGRLSVVTDQQGATTTFTRDGSGTVTAIANSDGADLTLTYDTGTPAQLIEVAASDGRTVTYDYDSGVLDEIVTPAGTTTLVDDTAGRIAEIHDGTAVVLVENLYDSGGRVIEQWMANGEHYTYDYDDATRTTVVEDVELDVSITYVHDPYARTVEILDPFGNALQVTDFDRNGNATEHVNRVDGVSSATYDASGNLTSVTEPGAGTTTYTWDMFGRLMTETVPNGGDGATTTYCYDLTNFPTDCWSTGATRVPVRVIDDLGHNTDFTVVDERVTQRVDADGVSTSYTYDADGRVTSMTDGVGNVTLTDYCPDSGGETVHVASPRGAATTDDPDPCASPDPDDFVTETRYDLAGRVQWERDAGGYYTYYTYDAAGRLASVADPGGGTTTYGYDAVSGELESVTTPGPTGSGQTTVSTSYETSYETIGGFDREVRTTTGPDGARTIDVYGPLQRLEESRQQVEGASTLTSSDDVYRTTSFTYTDDGQVATETNGAGDVTTTRYDTAGRVTETCDGEGRRTINAYDGIGRLQTVTGPYDDDLGSTTCGTDPLPGWAPVVTYAYDDLNRVIASAGPGARSSGTSYTDGGRTLASVDANSLTTWHTYDLAGRLSTVEAPGDVGQRLTTYQYDANSNRTDVIDGEGSQWHTGYDTLDRPEFEIDSAGTYTFYGWHPRGEPWYQVRWGEGFQFFYPDASGALASVLDGLDNETTYTYDAAGRRTSRTDALDGETSWTYYDDGQLRSVTDQLDRTTTYAYDGAGRLTDVDDPSGRSTSTYYNHAGQPTTISHDGGLSTDYYYNELGRRVFAVNADGGWTWHYSIEGDLFAQVDNLDRVTWFGHDAGGRRTTLIDFEGTTLTYDYEPLTGRLDKVWTRWTLADSFYGDGSAPEARRWATELSGGGTAETDDGRLALAVPATTGASAGVVSAADDTTDVDIAFSYQFDDLVNPSTVALNLRETTGGAYRLEIPSGSTTGSVLLVSGTTSTPIGSFAVPDTDALNRLHVSLIGDAVSVSAWDATDPEPFPWSTTVNDTGITTPGRVSLHLAEDGALDPAVVYVDDWTQRNDEVPRPIVDYDYDDADNVIAETLLDGGRTWDYVDGRLAGYDQTVPGAVRSTTLTYDSSGRLETETTGADILAYGYDLAGQLTSVTPDIGDATLYEYDELGRRTSVIVGTSNVTTYGYDAASQLGTVTPPSGPATTYAYDDAGRLLTATTGSDVEEYTYDPAGRLATIETASGYTQERAYDSVGRLRRVENDDGLNVNSFELTWDGSQLLSTAAVGDVRTMIGAAGRWAAVALGGPATDNASVALDVRGSVLPGDADPAPARAGAYDAWGQPTGAETLDPRLGYRGELQLGPFLHLRSRDYMASLGVFTTVDPLSGVDGMPTISNPYHYADISPINRADPSGLQSTDADFDDCSYYTLYTCVNDEIESLARLGTNVMEGPLRIGSNLVGLCGGVSGVLGLGPVSIARDVDGCVFDDGRTLWSAAYSAGGVGFGAGLGAAVGFGLINTLDPRNTSGATTCIGASVVEGFGAAIGVCIGSSDVPLTRDNRSGYISVFAGPAGGFGPIPVEAHLTAGSTSIREIFHHSNLGSSATWSDVGRELLVSAGREIAETAESVLCTVTPLTLIC